MVDGVRIMMDDAMIVLTHIMPDVIAYDARLVGPAKSAVEDTSRIWNIWEYRWTEPSKR